MNHVRMALAASAMALAATSDSGPSSRVYDVIASTSEMGSRGEVVVQDWNLERYLANPVVLWAHDGDELPIGSASNVRVEDGKLKATITLVGDDVNPKAGEVARGIDAKVINALSVGFTWTDVTLVTLPDGREAFALKGNELLEISFVPVGSNAGALVERVMQLECMRQKLTPVGAALVARGAPAAAQSMNYTLDLSTKVLNELTGCDTVENSIALAGAWRASHEALPQVQAKLAALEAAEAERVRLAAVAAEAAKQAEKDSLISSIRLAGKASKSMESFLQTLSVEQLKTFELNALVVLPRSPTLEPASANVGTVVSSWVGKTAEELAAPSTSFDVLHQLHGENPELYRQVMQLRRSIVG